jgi:hypothetical protein
LWRYVDLYKWLDLLQTSELHLTRADQMEDRWEGAYSEVNVTVRDEKQGDRRKIMNYRHAAALEAPPAYQMSHLVYVHDVQWLLHHWTHDGQPIRPGAFGLVMILNLSARCSR